MINILSKDFKGILLDAYGVFWGGNDFGLLPGAKESMEHLVRSGKIVGVLSNSTQLAVKEIAKLQKHGLIQGQHFHFFVTSGELVRDLFLNDKLPFKTDRKKFWLLGEVHPRFSSHEVLFQGTPYLETPHINKADFIYTAIPHLNGEDQTNPEVFRKEIEKLKNHNLPMVCPNPDHFAHEGNPPRAVVRQGSLAKMYEELGGQVFYCGKPNPLAYAKAMSHFHEFGIHLPEEVLMVGDTPETDIRGARRFGMPSALITKTGIMAGRSFSELSPQDTPDYLIERL